MSVRTTTVPRCSATSGVAKVRVWAKSSITDEEYCYNFSKTSSFILPPRHCNKPPGYCETNAECVETLDIKPNEPRPLCITNECRRQCDTTEYCLSQYSGPPISGFVCSQVFGKKDAKALPHKYCITPEESCGGLKDSTAFFVPLDPWNRRCHPYKG